MALTLKNGRKTLKGLIKLESSFQNAVIRKLKKIKGIYFFKKEAAAIRSIPDVIGSYKGRFFGWELKRSSKSKPTPLQIYTLKQIQKAGGIGEVVYPENFEEKLEELLNSPNKE